MAVHCKLCFARFSLPVPHQSSNLRSLDTGWTYSELFNIQKYAIFFGSRRTTPTLIKLFRFIFFCVIHFWILERKSSISTHTAKTREHHIISSPYYSKCLLVSTKYRYVTCLYCVHILRDQSSVICEIIFNAIATFVPKNKICMNSADSALERTIEEARVEAKSV